MSDCGFAACGVAVEAGAAFGLVALRFAPDFGLATDFGLAAVFGLAGAFGLLAALGLAFRAGALRFALALASFALAEAALVFPAWSWRP